MYCSKEALKEKGLTFTHILDIPLNVVWRVWEESPMIIDFKNIKNRKTKIIITKSYNRNGKIAGATTKPRLCRSRNSTKNP
jgi:hypothetical protein